MITTIKGDVLTQLQLGGVNALIHCANCKGVMGSGIALQIKNKFHQAYLEYKNHEKKHGLTLGTISKAETVFGHIFNLHAQQDYGAGKRQVDYEALYVSLEAVRNDLGSSDFKGVIGVPYKMASDRAGGDWNIVVAMIDSVFKDFEVLVVEYAGKN